MATTKQPDLVPRGQSEGLVPPTDVATDETLIEEAKGAPAPKRKILEVSAARVAEPGVDFVEHWDVAECDKPEHKASKLAGSRVLDVPNKVEDSIPLQVAVEPDFKGDIVKGEAGFQVVGT
jgi:hypothetical protein